LTFPASALIYDTAQNPIDVLAFTWPQYDGEGIDTSRSKAGVGAYVTLSAWCRALLDATEREAVQIVVSEQTKRPYAYRNFAKHVALEREAAGLPSELKAGNLRHEALQEAEDGGADPGAIQSLAAHKSVGTQKYYVRRRRADQAQEAREKLRSAPKNGRGTKREKF
jgi:integrase